MAHVATITIDSTKVAADLTDYPVYVDLSDLPASFWDVVTNGGGDIRVYKDDDTTELAREVVSCDTATDTGELHIKFSGTLSSSTDTDIHIYADGTSSEPASTATYGSEAVWTNYAAVYHGDDLTDSAGNYDLTRNSAPTEGNSTAKIGTSFNLDGTDDYYQNTSVTGESGNALSLQAWFRGDTDGATPYATFSIVEDTGAYAVLRWDSHSTDNPVTARYRNASRSRSASTTDGGSLSAATWYMQHGVFPTSKVPTIYLNGGNAASNSSGLDPVTITPGTIYVGITGFVDYHFDGYLDELRWRTDELSANWITTEYNNQNSPATFYTAAAAASAGTSLVLPEPRMEMPTLLIPGQKPVGNVAIDWSHPISSGLVFGLLAGHNTPLDLVGGNLLSYTGARASAAGSARGDYLLFSDNTDYGLDVGVNPKFGITSAITQFAIASFSSKSDGRVLCGKGLGGNPSFAYDLKYNVAADAIRMSLRNSTGQTNINGTTSPTLNQVYSIAGTWDDSDNNAYIYLDGVQDGTGTFAGPIITVPPSFKVGIPNGWVSGGAGEMAGKIYCVFLWNRRLPATEIKSLALDPYQFLIPA